MRGSGKKKSMGKKIGGAKKKVGAKKIGTKVIRRGNRSR